MKQYGLCKTERLKSLTAIDTLFKSSESQHLSAFPLSAVTLLTQRTDRQPQNAILVSVPKRLFKHSVDRNRIKRQVREAYRLNKDILLPLQQQWPDKVMLIAFIYRSAQHTPQSELSRRVKRLLHLIVEKQQEAQ